MKIGTNINQVVKVCNAKRLATKEELGKIRQETLGYELRDRKHLLLLPEGRKQAVMTERLGVGYTREEISDRIMAQLPAPTIQERIVTYGDRIYIRNCILRKRKR